MRKTLVQRLLSTRIGQVLFLPVRPLVRFARRQAHPDVAPGHKVTTVQYNGSPVTLLQRRWSVSDAMAIQQCFVDNQYDILDGKQKQAIESIYTEILSAGRRPLIMDCGANIGASVAWFAKRYPEAHIIAVEPAPGNCDLLRHNTKGLDVEVFQAGIASQDGQAYLINRYEGEEMSFEITAEPTSETVDLLSVMTLLAGKPADRFSPFLLKIDIEGSEKDLFAGDTATINRFPFILMEPHDWLYPGAQVSQSFFRFHVEAGRDFAMKHENVASLALTGLQS